MFGALLDAGRGGHFRVAPAAGGTAERCYAGETNVLETTFATETGRLRLTDAMPVRAAGDALWPPGSLVRVAFCTDGEVDVAVSFVPRFAYGRAVPRLRRQGDGAFVCTHGVDAVALRTDAALGPSEREGGVAGTVRLRQGDRRVFAVSHAYAEPLVLPPVGERALALVEEAGRWWAGWARRCAYDGPYRDAVVRSALALKLLIYAPSGAVVAAGTTSLPEEIGGVRNWDYRFCWLRDASLTMRALMGLGYTSEGAAYLGWLTHATNLTWPRLRVLYDVYGGVRRREAENDHLAGYRGSRPVRVGNGAAGQLQLDVYGEVVGAVDAYLACGGRLGRRDRRRLAGLGHAVCDLWDEPDAGIWEKRDEPAHHVYSKAMCWCVLDKLIRLHEAGHLRVPAGRFAAVRDAIRERIERDGYDEAAGSYVDAFGRPQPDASLLLLAAQGYTDAGAPRMRSTYDYLAARLRRNGLWYRYPPGPGDGLPGTEGAFGACAFWAAEYLARRGDAEAATRTFERALACANDVGLFAEETDPERGNALGNFPQAFTHVGLINAALALAAHPEARGARVSSFPTPSTSR